MLLLSALSAGAATRYLVPAGTATPESPYATWATAATNILTAYTGTADGDTIIVSNGVYLRAGNNSINTNLTWRSVNGPDVTIISGGGGDYALYLTSATLIGLTVCASTGAWGGIITLGTVSMTNCIVRNNRGDSASGGITIESGSVTLNNCTLKHNSGVDGTIRVAAGATATLTDCVIVSNTASHYGGGIHVISGGKATVTRTTISYNTGTRGSAVYGGAASAASLTNCIITYNDAGADQCTVYRADLTGCLVAGNRAQYQPGGNGCLMQSCTLLRNYAYGANESPNYLCSGANNILWGNFPYDLQTVDGPYSNTCYGTKVGSPTLGANVITNYPIFTTDWSAAGTAANTGTNWVYAVPALASNSPCVNVGTNQPWMVGALDLAGNDRIYADIVDMGAYEWLPVADTVSEDYSARALMLWRSMQ